MNYQTYNIDLERTILSSLIYDPTLLQTYNSELDIELFVSPFHKTLLDTILKLEKSGNVVDEVVIRNKLGNSYENDILLVLTANPVNNLSTYLELLIDHKMKRDIQSILLNVGQDISNSSGQELQAKILDLSNNLQSSRKTIFDINNIKKIEEAETTFICKSWLPFPKRTVSLVTAPGGTGKSWLVLQLAIRAILEKDITKAFLWLSEDPKELTKNRFNKIFNELLHSKEEWVKDKIDISDSATIQFLYDEQRKVEVSPLLHTFKLMLDSYDLVILDPLIAFYGTDENNNASARRFMQLFTEWANKENKTIIFIHHSTKNTTQSRGASAFVDAVRVVYELDKVKDADGKTIENNKREVKLTKDNYGVGNITGSYRFERLLFPEVIKEKVVEYKTATNALNKEPVFNMDSFLHPDF